MPSNTITSTSLGVTLTSAGYDNPVTVTSGVYVSGPQAGIYSTSAWTIVNQGTVVGTAAAGVLLKQGGYVINGQSGGTVAAASISGAEGVYIRGAAGTVTNYGIIGGNFDGVLLDLGGAVTNGASGATGAQIIGSTGVGVFTAAGTVNNDATITGTFENGVMLVTGGVVINGAGDPTGSAALITGNNYGVEVRGAGGTVINYGTLQGAFSYGARVYGGTLVNGVSGTNVALITGYGGLAGYKYSLDVTNYGSILGTNDGVALNNGGSINNAQASASIIGGNGGIDIFGGGTVSNLGTIVGTTLHGIYLFDGGNVTNGQSGGSISGALISGGYYGIRIGFNNSASGTVTNFGTVLAAGNHTVPPTNAYSAVLIDGAGSVANYGIIRADAANSFDRAIRFNAGGSVSNAASGTIAGDSAGVYIAGDTGTVSNAGSISGVNSNGGDGVDLVSGGLVANTATTASIRGAASGVDISGAAGTVTNIGSITGFGPLYGGLSSAMGVELRQGGSVQNGQPGTGSGHIYGYANGVYVYGPTYSGTSLGTGTVTNYGTIIGRGAAGVNLMQGGAVTNGAAGTAASTAYIYGGGYGVVTDFSNGTNVVIGTVINFGTIIGAASNEAGVALRSGGTLVNAEFATISGGYGVIALGPAGIGLTVVNAGTISGTGANGFAVWFQTPNDVLVDVPGAVFNGAVIGGGNATLELASASGIGTLSGLSTDFTNFDSITIDANAHWTITNANTVPSGEAITINSGADLEVTGTLTGAASFTLLGGTLGFANAVDAGATFDFTDPGVLQADTLTLGAVTGSSFDNAITGFSGHDEIVVPNVAFVAGSTPTIGSGAVTIDVVGGGTFAFSNFAFQAGTPQTLLVGSDFIRETACFVAGTRILTEQGEVPVEALRPGDLVVTLHGAAQPVRWIGQRRIDLTRHPEPRRAQPIRVRGDAIADGVPRRDLLVSPDHALFIDGGLVPARMLLNGASIVREAGWRSVHYFHVELDAHNVLFADGMPAESYLDTGNRGMFENAGEPITLHPDLMADDGQHRRETESCAPFIADASRVEPLWRQLAARAQALGYVSATTDDPALSVIAADKRLQPVSVAADRYIFALPHRAGEVRLVSRAAAPCDVTPWVEDRRRLGVMLRRILLHRGADRQDIALDDPMLRGGWWPVERGEPRLWRWSDGDALLSLPKDVTLLEVHVGAGMVYPADEIAEPSRYAA